MKKALLLLFCLTSIVWLSAHSTDTLRLPSYLAIGGSVGSVLPTNEFTSGSYEGGYVTVGAKYALTGLGKDWQREAYRDIYYGVGISQTYFGRPEKLGNPISLYLFQGGTLWNIHPKLRLHYELNLGASFNWVPYDSYLNPENIAIGSKTNVLAAALFYFNWHCSPHFDVRLGAITQHFSNGATKAPNAGLNMIGGFLEVAYQIQREPSIDIAPLELTPPEVIPHFEHDIQVVISNRNIKVDTFTRNMTDIYIEKDFFVMGLNYYLKRTNHYKFRYGIGVQNVYDDRKGTSVHNIYDSYDDSHTLIYKHSPFIKRSTFGIAIRGEVVLPYYSFFADVSLHYTPLEKKMLFYQTVGIKANITSGLYVTTGIKAMQLSKAQYIYWSVGYTFRKQ